MNPQNDESAQILTGQELVMHLVNSTIIVFGSDGDGGIFMSTKKDGVTKDVLISVSETTGELVMAGMDVTEVAASTAGLEPDEQVGIANG